mgnify:CR=1 FL=1
MGLTLLKELTLEERISNAQVTLMNHDRYIAMAGVILMVQVTVKDDVPTAYTNGRDVVIGREFGESLTDAELRFVLLHELYHILFQHLRTWNFLYKRDHHLANVACDYVINLMIDDDNTDGFAPMPRTAQGEPKYLLDTKYRGMDTLQVFQQLQLDPPDPNGGGGKGGELDEHGWEEAEEIPDSEQEAFGREVDEAIRQGALTAGKTGSGGNRAVDDLLQPEVNWREVLREFITQTCRGNDYSTYSRPNRRYMSAGRYFPSGVSESVDELIIAIDTSGSIGQQELTKFLSEIQGAVEVTSPSSIRVLYWDTEVCRDEVYGEQGQPVDQLVHSTKPAGGGGTWVGCVNKYIQEKQIQAQATIVFTDGYLGGDWGTWSNPLLWCILDNKSAKPTTGTAIHINL